MSEMVEVEADGPVLLIGVNRTAKRNAWNREIIAAVGDAYERLRDDDSLRVGVVHAHGDHFSAGLDLPDVLPALAEDTAGGLIRSDQPDPWGFLGEPCPKPVVIAAQGRCYTLGIELILAAQAAVVAEDTIFAQLEVARGIIPLGGGGHRLPALGKRGMQWLLTAETFDAHQALEAGMVSEVVPTGTQLERATEIAHTIAANAPLAVRAALANSRAAQRASDEAAAAQVGEVGQALFTSEDAMEAVAAMTERRDPVFRGA
ncbi:MAG: crotonase/enoyl-CoA hydratase family protein [Microthrixaceae bacterium]|nr:crotonase/enoyl-CoA hydratase family protein [Microthrixaceae bacterium]MCO5322229.1 crotonase/enoyl-CoA hydratase family protein [Microthrixaceae bacterium]